MKLVSELSFFCIVTHAHMLTSCIFRGLVLGGIAHGDQRMASGVLLSHAQLHSLEMVSYWTKSLNGDQPAAVILLPLPLPVLGLQVHVLFI